MRHATGFKKNRARAETSSALSPFSTTTTSRQGLLLCRPPGRPARAGPFQDQVSETETATSVKNHILQLEEMRGSCSLVPEDYETSILSGVRKRAVSETQVYYCILDENHGVRFSNRTDHYSSVDLIELGVHCRVRSYSAPSPKLCTQIPTKSELFSSETLDPSKYTTYNTSPSPTPSPHLQQKSESPLRRLPRNSPLHTRPISRRTALLLRIDRSLNPLAPLKSLIQSHQDNPQHGRRTDGDKRRRRTDTHGQNISWPVALWKHVRRVDGAGVAYGVDGREGGGAFGRWARHGVGDPA